MKFFSFCILTTLALLYAGLTVVETMTYRKWEKALNDQKDVQLKVTYFQNTNKVLDQLVHQLAYDSLGDPQIAQMLKERKIKVVIEGAQATNNATGGGTPLAPLPNSNPSQPASVPANPPSSHP